MRSVSGLRGSGFVSKSGSVPPTLLAALVACLFCLVAAGAVVASSTISPGNVGIVVSKTGPSRGVQDLGVKTGWVFANPITTEVIEYPVFVQTVKWTASANEGHPSDESITFTTKDSMIVNADISVSYELHQDKAPEFYVKFRADKITDFTEGYLRNITRDAFNEEAGQYTVEQVMGDNADLLKKVKASVTNQVKSYGIVIDQLGFIGAPRPPEGVLNAINNKVQAAQIALQKQNEVAQATADAASRVAAAKGDAEAAIERATGQATANQKLASSLSPTLIEWRKLDNQSHAIDKWDGHRPHVEGAGAGFMIDVGK